MLFLVNWQQSLLWKFHSVCQCSEVVGDTSWVRSEKQVSYIVKACFFHLRALSKVCSLLTCKAANAIAVCLILSKLDYCNSLLAGLPQTQIKRLQAVQNAAAKVMMKQRKHDHITPTLRDLHWLPEHDRILHNCCLSLIVLSMKPCHSISLNSFCHTLRLATKSFLDVPGPKDCKTKQYGQRAFRYTAPSQWNAQPRSIRETLKTHFSL